MPSGHSSQVSFFWLVTPAGALRYTLTHSVAQLCLTLSDPMDCSPPGSSVHEIIQARIQTGLPFPLPGNLPNLGTEPISPASPALEGRFLYH